MITASIVLYKNTLEECHSILDCLLASPIEKIYLVDHSGNDSLSVLSSYSPKIEYIQHKNSGYGSGHNVAIKKAIASKSKYHLITNSDILFEKETIPAIVRYLESNPDIAHVMPKVYYPDGRVQFVCKLLPTPFDMIARGFIPERFIKRSQNLFTLSFSNYTVPINAPYLSGCFMFVRTSVLEEVGGFDERYFMHAEDIDLTRRIHAKYKTVMYPSASIIHNHAATHKHSWNAKKVIMANTIKYFNKWGWFFDKQRKQLNEQVLQELASQGIYPKK